MNKPQTHFTPGPWNFDRLAISENHMVYVTGSDQNGIDINRPLLEISANAALIAAAPDMFSALVEVSEFLEMLADMNLKDYPITLPLLRGTVETAIEKATKID